MALGRFFLVLNALPTHVAHLALALWARHFVAAIRLVELETAIWAHPDHPRRHTGLDVLNELLHSALFRHRLFTGVKRTGLPSENIKSITTEGRLFLHLLGCWQTCVSSSSDLAANPASDVGK